MEELLRPGKKPEFPARVAWNYSLHRPKSEPDPKKAPKPRELSVVLNTVSPKPGKPRKPPAKVKKTAADLRLENARLRTQVAALHQKAVALEKEKQLHFQKLRTLQKAFAQKLDQLHKSRRQELRRCQESYHSQTERLRQENAQRAAGWGQAEARLQGTRAAPNQGSLAQVRRALQAESAKHNHYTTQDSAQVESLGLQNKRLAASFLAEKASLERSAAAKIALLEGAYRNQSDKLRQLQALLRDTVQGSQPEHPPTRRCLGTGLGKPAPSLSTADIRAKLDSVVAWVNRLYDWEKSHNPRASPGSLSSEKCFSLRNPALLMLDQALSPNESFFSLQSNAELVEQLELGSERPQVRTPGLTKGPL